MFEPVMFDRGRDGGRIEPGLGLISEDPLLHTPPPLESPLLKAGAGMKGFWDVI